MRLARCGLPVGEDGAVESLDNAIDDGGGRIIIHFFLIGVDIKDLIKGKLQRLLFFIFNGDGLVV